MDEATLNGLISAYTNAPSPQLSLVIVKRLIESGDLKKASGYLALKGLDITRDDLYFLGKAYAECEELNLFSQFFCELSESDLSLFSRYLIDTQNVKLAGKFLAGIRATAVVFQYEPLEMFVDAQVKPDSSERPKLKVVEKVDFNKVTDLMRYAQDTTTFKDVVGLENIKKQIQKKIILPFQKPSLIQRFKKKVGGGVLLYGPPGCGKTLLARATAGECNASFFNIEISDVLDMYIGESEQKLHAIFEKARNETPSVLFFDELEALAGKREHMRNASSSNTVSQFLTELDGFTQNNSGVLVLASTNVPWAIDPAFLRPGRFDRMFFVPPPDKIARAAILKHHMQGRPHNKIQFENIASKTSGYSGADISNLADMAADEAIDESMETGSEDIEISMEHFKAALNESRATTTEWLTTARNYARYSNDGGRYDDVLEFLKKYGK